MEPIYSYKISHNEAWVVLKHNEIYYTIFMKSLFISNQSFISRIYKIFI